MSVNNIVLSYLEIYNTKSFRCHNIVDRQNRMVDIIEGTQHIEFARSLEFVNFDYIQKSQVHVLSDSKIVVVSNDDGTPLARYVSELPLHLEETFIRLLIRNILEVIIYLADEFKIDFEFGIDDVIVYEIKHEKEKYQFKLRNSFIQKSKFNRLRSNSNAYIRVENTVHSRLSVIPELAIRSLGSIIMILAKNRYGFYYNRSDMNCPFLSESLKEIINSMISYSAKNSAPPKSYMKSLMTGKEMKLERGKLAHQAFIRYMPRSKSTSGKRNSNPF
jgi:hypothetical protein